MRDDFLLTDDGRLIAALVRDGLAHHARDVATMAGVDPDYAVDALRRMSGPGSEDYPVLHRFDLGADYYEATEDSARSWTGAD